MQRINILASTMSGSMRDWEKVDSIRDTFKSHYEGDIHVYILDSHKEIKGKVTELALDHENIFVSAGGAGTFKSVIDGIIESKVDLTNVRIAFLRKGSADLLGKVLNVPDELNSAAKLICENIIKDNILQVDIIDILNNDKAIDQFVGFSGLGIFGLIPHFTESKVNKYYKGILGSLFGDRGPFIVGLTLSVFKFYIQKITHGSFYLEIDTANKKYPKEKYSSVIIVSGDLGKDFPIALGSSLSNSKFNAVLFKDRGILNSIKQALVVWNNKTSKIQGESLGIEELEVNELNIKSLRENLDINVDGLKTKSEGEVRYKISKKISLIDCTVNK